MVADAVASTGNIDAAIRIEDAIGGTSDDALMAVYGDSDLLLSRRAISRLAATAMPLSATEGPAPTPS